MAYILNTLNLLGPVLLFLALILLSTAAWGDWAPTEKTFWITAAGVLIAVALVLRIIWGIAVAVVRRRAPHTVRSDSGPQTVDGRH